MICRQYQQGRKLDGAGLNVVTVLVARSETQLTEVGWNRWLKGLEGPPHSHQAKEQILYVTDGEGIVVVGPARYAVKPGSLVYVPPRVVHQTLATGEAPLSHFLFDAFLDATKEGHASFADHIAEVKEVRPLQAASQQAAVAGAEGRAASDLPGKLVADIHAGRLFDFGSNTTRLILERSEAVRTEVTLVSWPKGSKGAMVSHSEKEQTFFVLSGRGRVTVGEETFPVAVGDVVFVPWKAPHTTEAGDDTLTYLCLNTHVIETKEGSFEAMYHRVAPGRIARWKSGDATVRKSPGKRRCALFELLALAVLWTAPGPGTAAPLPDIFSYRANDVASLRQGFARPPREAVLFHLNFMFSRLDPKLGRYYGTTLVDAASDSWEFERPEGGGRYWSPAIFDAFPKEAGYDLRARMHALLGYGPGAGQVLHDLESVERLLVHRNFFGTVTGFLNERGLRHRPQAYGRGLPRDLLFAYTLSDTPEIEPTLVLPEAPWAARTTGKPIVSAEAFTFLGLYQGEGKSPVRNLPGLWEATPAALRLAANHYYGEGINRIQMHGFGYSPPGLPLPGWRMYAEIHLNRNVPWWPFIRPLTTWMARQQWLLQAGWPVADALVYPVKSSPDDGPFFNMGESQPISAGNAVDAANELTLPAVLRACAAGHCAVTNLCLLDDLRTVDEARHFLQLLDAGARLLACKSMPSDWPALREAGAESLRKRYAQAQTEGRVVDGRADGWKTTLGKIRSVQWIPATAKLVFQHRRVRDAEIYFLVNYGDAFRGQVSFPHAGQRPESWNPDTGQATPVGRYTEQHGRIHVPVTLAHFESAFFVFSPLPALVHVTEADRGTFHADAKGGAYGEFDQPGDSRIELSDGTVRTLVVSLPPPLAVPGPWQLSVSANQAVSPQAPLSLHLDRLASWRTLPELRHYAGSATYTTEIDVPPASLAGHVAWQLELGDVFELARVKINDRDAGTAWRHPFRVDATGLLRAGRNSLRIEVPNLLKNHLEIGDSYQRPSGLLGPVVLRPLGRVPVGPSPARADADPARPGLVGPWYGNPDFTRPKGGDLLRTLAPEFDSETGFGSSWSAMWEGELVAPATGTVTFRARASGRMSLKIGGATILETKEGVAIGTMETVRDRAYPIQVCYSHQSEGKGAFRVEWSWNGRAMAVVPGDRIRHAIAQEEYWNCRPEPDPATVDRSAFRRVGAKHVIVFGEPGRFAGWPANNGLWSWGNEILVGFSLGYHKSNSGGGHAIDPARPPSSFSRAWRKPRQPVPLQAGPPLLFPPGEATKGVLPLGTRKHVFLDDALIDQLKNLEFALQSPSTSVRVHEDVNGHTSLVEDEQGLLRLYYRGPRDSLAVLTSRDGLRWQTPDLGREYAGARNVVVRDAVGCGNVFVDPNAPPAERWKHVSGRNGETIFIDWSADGWTFTRGETAVIPLAAGSQSTVFYDDQRQLHIGHHRSDSGSDPEGHTRRMFMLTELKDLMMPWPFKPVTPEDTARIARTLPIKNDQLDPWYLDNGPLSPTGLGVEYPVAFQPDPVADLPGVDMYVPKAIKYPWAPDACVAFPTMFFHYDSGPDTRKILGQGGRLKRGDGPTECQLAVSRDGVHWRRLPRPAYIGIGRHDGKNLKMIHSTYNLVRRPALRPH